MIKNNREFEVIFISPNDKYCYSWLYSKLQVLKRRTKLFNLLKTELSKQGYWKNKARRIPDRDELKRNAG